MKVLVFFASHNKKGHTHSLLEHFLKFVKKSEVFVVDCYEEKIRACIGCGRCKDSYKCIFRDMDEINALIDSCDVIIIATPIYNASFPAPLKSIFDRLQPYYFSRKKIKRKEKKFLILTSQGSENIDYSPHIFAQLEPIIKILNGKFCGKIMLKGTDNKKLDIDKFYVKSENDIVTIINNINGI